MSESDNRSPSGGSRLRRPRRTLRAASEERQLVTFNPAFGLQNDDDDIRDECGPRHAPDTMDHEAMGNIFVGCGPSLEKGLPEVDLMRSMEDALAGCGPRPEEMAKSPVIPSMGDALFPPQGNQDGGGLTESEVDLVAVQVYESPAFEGGVATNSLAHGNEGGESVEGSDGEDIESEIAKHLAQKWHTLYAVLVVWFCFALLAVAGFLVFVNCHGFC